MNTRLDAFFEPFLKEARRRVHDNFGGLLPKEQYEEELEMELDGIAEQLLYVIAKKRKD